MIFQISFCDASVAHAVVEVFDAIVNDNNPSCTVGLALADNGFLICRATIPREGLYYLII